MDTSNDMFYRGDNMNAYEQLLSTADDAGVDVIDYNFRSQRIKGLYCDGTIALNEDIPTTAEKACVLAEELGHYHTSSGDIILKNPTSAKQEQQARLWGYNNRIGLSGLISCYKADCHNLYEMAEHLDVTEEFLQEALECYRHKYGIYTQVDNYVIFFEPNIGVLELV